MVKINNLLVLDKLQRSVAPYLFHNNKRLLPAFHAAGIKIAGDMVLRQTIPAGGRVAVADGICQEYHLPPYKTILSHAGPGGNQ